MTRVDIARLLNTNFSADAARKATPDELAEKLVAAGLILDKADMNCLVIEGIQKAVMDDDEFPIHYYSKDEEMSESGRRVEDIECLTDDYIATHFSEP